MQASRGPIARASTPSRAGARDHRPERRRQDHPPGADLTRDGIFDCLRKRHHYGTTGCRMHVEVTAAFPVGGNLYDRNPNAFADAKSKRMDTAMMGDIVRQHRARADYPSERRRMHRITIAGDEPF